MASNPSRDGLPRRPSRASREPGGGFPHGAFARANSAWRPPEADGVNEMREHEVVEVEPAARGEFAAFDYGRGIPVMLILEVLGCLVETVMGEVEQKFSMVAVIFHSEILVFPCRRSGF